MNTDKTKCMIFAKRKLKRKPQFFYDGIELEIVDSYNYLGIVMNCNGRFSVAKKKLVEQATKAMYSVYKHARRLNLTPDLQLKLFDSLVSPVLLYCSEVWGYEKCNDIEKVHLSFCKKILCVKRSTPNYLVYGELGRTPIQDKIHVCLLRALYPINSYWSFTEEKREERGKRKGGTGGGEF